MLSDFKYKIFVIYREIIEFFRKKKKKTFLVSRKKILGYISKNL